MVVGSPVVVVVVVVDVPGVHVVVVVVVVDVPQCSTPSGTQFVTVQVSKSGQKSGFSG